MRQLLDQWFHPAFASIEEFSELLAATGLVEGRKINRNTFRCCHSYLGKMGEASG